MSYTRHDASLALVFALLAAALGAQSADAQQPNLTSANVFVPECQKFLANNATDFGPGLCSGIVYVLGYVGKALPPQFSSCIPDSTTNAQGVRVVLAYIERRPQRMHEDFRRLAIEALHEAWPCT
jgi:hypothetical protein